MIGLAAGSWLPTVSVLVSTNFGLAAYGAIFGTVILFLNIGAATGPLLAGYIYDAMGTYHWAFMISLALNIVALSTTLAIRRPKALLSYENK